MKGNLKENIKIAYTFEKMLKSLILKYIEQCDTSFHVLFFVCKNEKEKPSYYMWDMKENIAFIQCNLRI